MKLGELLKSYRTDHKLSMDAFCELSDLTKGYISMLEKNEHPKSKKPIVPSYDTIEKIAKGMQISTEDLIDMLDDDQEIQINSTPPHLKSISIKPNASLSCIFFMALKAFVYSITFSQLPQGIIL